MLIPTTDRLVLFPIREQKIWEMCIKAEQSVWFVPEVDLTTDVKDWVDKLTPNERHYLSHVLAYFASSDNIVNENLAVNFLRQVQNSESRYFYGIQIFMENIHSRM